MKRKLIVTLSVICLVSMAACSKEPASTTEATTESTQVETSSEPATTEASTSIEAESSSEPETTTVAETESQAKLETSPLAGMEELGDQLSDPVKIALDGVVYMFPGSTFADFEANGWVIDPGALGSSLAANHTTSVEFTKGDAIINLSASNNGDAALSITECECWALVYKDKNLDYTFPGGIVDGSTPEEIEAAYGEPDSFYDLSEGVRSSMEYKFENSKIKFQFYEGGLSSFDIRS